MNDARRLAGPDHQTSLQTFPPRARHPAAAPSSRAPTALTALTAPAAPAASANPQPWRLPPTLAYLRALREADHAVRQAIHRHRVLRHSSRLNPG